MTCPSTETIALFVLRQLEDGKTHGVETHLADCPSCRRVVGTLAAGSLPSFVGEPVASKPPPTDHHGRYVIRQELARGGMGRISIADDTLLGRAVAIKELLSPSDELIARFQCELALTARLQHPSIVTIHDSGTWETGEPFYVMRLVSGEPLDRVIARQVDVASRIALVPQAIAMTDALAYAHAEGIIHRDLKPQNVLLGDFGETVVIDWGLAKDLRANTDEVRRLVGTPAYMAPEQARGEPVGERADVYALGAVLYHLFAGAPPYTGSSVDAVLDEVRAAPPRPLGERMHGIPPDLLAIVAKAMARMPEERYANAGALAIDLKRFERGQLVGAHHYTWWQLVGRWVRKHRAAVAVAMVAVVALATLGIASVRRVVAEQDRAEHRRADADALLGFMLTTLHDKLEPLGKLDLLGVVADKAREYYDQHPDDQRLGDRLARVEILGNLGEVLAAHGDETGALAEYRNGLERAEQLARERPDDPKVRHAVQAMRANIGDMLFGRGDVAGALAEYDLVSASARRAVESAPTDANASYELAVAQMSTGRAYSKLGNTDAALREYRAVRVRSETFAASSPDDDRWSESLAQAHQVIGAVLVQRGDAPGAIIDNRAAVSVQAKLVARDPASSVHQYELARVHVDLGFALETSEPAAALAEYRTALAISAMLIARDPTNTDWQSEYAREQGYAGSVLLILGDSGNALVAFQAALASDDRQAAATPTNDAVQRQVLADRAYIAQVMRVRGDNAGALREYEAALVIARQRAARFPSNVDCKRELGALLGSTGVLLLASKDAAGALVKFRAAAAIQQPEVDRDPSNSQLQHDLFKSTLYQGKALAELDPTASLATLRQAAALVAAQAKRTPDDPQVQQDRYDSHALLGDVLLSTKLAADAVTELRAAVAIAVEQAAKHPEITDWQESLALGHGKLADALLAAQSSDAQTELRAAIVAAQALAARDPTNPARKRRLDDLRAKLR